MSSNKIGKYSKRILPEVKQAVKALDHEVRWAIVSALEQYEDLSFSELKDFLGISKSNLYYHLKQLMAGGIIESYSNEIEISPYRSYYRLTKLGKSFISALSKALLPPYALMHLSWKYVLMETIEMWRESTSFRYVHISETPKIKIGGKGEIMQLYLEKPSKSSIMLAVAPTKPAYWLSINKRKEEK